MNKKHMKIRLQTITIVILLLNVSYAFAQESKQDTRYVSEKYNFAFQMPKDSLKNIKSTEQIFFTGDYYKFGLIAELKFNVTEVRDAKQFSKDLGSEKYTDALAVEIAESKRMDEIILKVLEKKRLKIAGLNAFKIVYREFHYEDEISNGTRTAIYYLPVPEHKRLYMFEIEAYDGIFDKWYPVAEESVKSFELIKAKSK